MKDFRTHFGYESRSLGLIVFWTLQISLFRSKWEMYQLKVILPFASRVPGHYLKLPKAVTALARNSDGSNLCKQIETEKA